MPLISIVTCTEKTNISPLRICGNAGKRLKVGKEQQQKMIMVVEIDIIQQFFPPGSLE